MKTASILAFAAIGVTVGLLFTTQKGAAIRGDIADAAEDLKHKLGDMSRKTVGELSDLKDVVSKEIKGLGSDARKRILDILDEGTDSGRKIKGKIQSEMA
jgi:gas vesicle protein